MTTRDPDQYKANLDRQVQDIKITLDWSLEHQLRKRFDNAFVDSAAQACIVYAKERGFKQLASEMENDLASEKRV